MPLGSTSSVLAVVIKYDCLALRIMSPLELMSSDGMIWRSLMECPVKAKCSETAVG